MRDKKKKRRNGSPTKDSNDGLKRSLKVHAAVFVLTSLLLLTINLLFTPSFLWFLIPLLGWFVALSLHGVALATRGMKSADNRALIIHLTAFLTGNLLLASIDSLTSDSFYWSYYPLLGWFAVLSLHAVSQALSARDVNSTKVRLLVLHLTSYLSVNVLLVSIDYLTSGILSWSYFPLIFWGFGLLAHGVLHWLTPKDARKEVIAQKKKLPLKKDKRKPFLARKSREESKAAENNSISRLKPKNKMQKPPKKNSKVDGSSTPLTAEEKKELAQTESEVDLEEQEAKCIVHKGPIDGTVYICPECKAYYCLKCAKYLKQKGESCWSCGNELNP